MSNCSLSMANWWVFSVSSCQMSLPFLPRKMAASPDSPTGHRPTSTTALIPPTFYPDGEDPPKTTAPAPSAQKKH